MFKFKPPTTRTEVLVCACINLFATPGLGTIVGGRMKTGIPQLVLSGSGFLLVLYWFVQKMRVLYDQLDSGTLPPHLGNTAGLVGVSLFALAWFWALVSTISLYKSLPMSTPPPLPPKVHNL
ncbi:MAG: hypothetical protein ACK4UN_09805 [Limisphaerales bacterium]